MQVSSNKVMTLEEELECLREELAQTKAELDQAVSEKEELAKENQVVRPKKNMCVSHKSTYPSLDPRP